MFEPSYENEYYVPYGLEDNDPRFTKMTVGSDMDDDWYPHRAGAGAGAIIERVGRLIGEHEHLRKLIFSDEYLVERDIQSFFRGVSNNRTIRELVFSAFRGAWGSVFEVLAKFLMENTELQKLAIGDCHNMRQDAIRSLSSTLRTCTSSSLNEIILYRQDITDELSAELISSFASLPQLTKVDLVENRVGIMGCEALAALLRNPRCQLQEIKLGSNWIDDKGAAVLAQSLAGNDTLTTLDCGGAHTKDQYRQNRITNKAWQSFVQLLCNTQSVNETFLSNHTLLCVHSCSEFDRIPPLLDELRVLLDLNTTGLDRKQIAMKKTLQYHSDFDMEPFFEWELRLLPQVVNWFASALERVPLGENAPERSDQFGRQQIENTKLSALFHFTRGMADEVVDGFFGRVRNTKKTELPQNEESSTDSEQLDEPLAKKPRSE